MTEPEYFTQSRQGRKVGQNWISPSVLGVLGERTATFGLNGLNGRDKGVRWFGRTVVRLFPRNEKRSPGWWFAGLNNSTDSTTRKKFRAMRYALCAMRAKGSTGTEGK